MNDDYNSNEVEIDGSPSRGAKMSAVLEGVIYLDEVAEFLASRPLPAEVLAFRPSEAVEARFAELIANQRAANLSDEEREELEQFQQTEMLLRLLKARWRRG